MGKSISYFVVGLLVGLLAATVGFSLLWKMILPAVPPTFRAFRNKLVRLLEIVVCTIMGLLVLDVIGGVFTRYLLGSQSKWAEEMAQP